MKTGSRLYRHTYGYAASETERADDLNEMVSDKDVKLVLFGGGYGSIELLPYIDYEAIRRNPKLFSSHSDGTSILNAIYTLSLIHISSTARLNFSCSRWWAESFG